MSSGIYKILNLRNGHQYVGSSVNLAKRKSRHCTALARGTHPNPYLQSAWNKYGADAFDFRVIGYCAEERVVALEQEVMDHLKPEYNLSPMAGSSLGVKHSAQTRRKNSEVHKGRHHTAEARKNMSEAQKGRRHSAETRRKMTEAHQNISAETRRKMSEAHKGKRPTEETRRRMSEAGKGRLVTEETRRKIGAANKGRRHSEEARRNMGKASRGRPMHANTRRALRNANLGRLRWTSLETRQKISISQRARQAREREAGAQG